MNDNYGQPNPQQQEREQAQELVKQYGKGLGDMQGVLGEPHYSNQHGYHRDLWTIPTDPFTGKLGEPILEHLPEKPEPGK